MIYETCLRKNGTDTLQIHKAPEQGSCMLAPSRPAQMHQPGSHPTRLGAWSTGDCEGNRAACPRSPGTDTHPPVTAVQVVTAGGERRAVGDITPSVTPHSDAPGALELGWPCRDVPNRGRGAAFVPLRGPDVGCGCPWGREPCPWPKVAPRKGLS